MTSFTKSIFPSPWDKAQETKTALVEKCSASSLSLSSAAGHREHLLLMFVLLGCYVCLFVLLGIRNNRNNRYNRNIRNIKSKSMFKNKYKFMCSKYCI